MSQQAPTFLKTYHSLVSEQLTALIPSDKSSYDALFECARYALDSGKHLRPLLTLGIAEDHGVCIDKSLNPACAIELVHVYSLIHDDLPCMDDDDFRRGKPSLHKAFSESEAILTGDYLLTLAFDILSSSPHLSPTEKVALIQSLAKASGGDGLIGGQIIDLASEGDSLSLEELEKMFTKKTGELFSVSFLFGAILSGYSQEKASIFADAGKHLGISFQYMNDLIDKEERNSDLKKEKATCIRMQGRELSIQRMDKHYETAMQSIESIERPMTCLKEVLQLMQDLMGKIC